MAAIVFAISSGEASPRGSIASGKDSVAAIARFIDGWKKRCPPFAWTKPVAEVCQQLFGKLLPKRDT
jgi:hypothetical protein